MPRIKAATLMLSLATLSVPAFAQGTDPAVRDSFSTLNYVQGQATLDGQPITTGPNTAPRKLHTGDTLATTEGVADVTLAPGSLLRLGAGANVRIVEADGNRAEVRLENGRANVAVNALRPSSLLLVDTPNGQTQILDRGLYTFDTASATVRVFNGRADVFPGANTGLGVKPVKLKDEHELVLSDDQVKPMKFDREESQSDLLPWTGRQEAHADGDYGLPANSGQGGAEYAAAPYGYAAGPYAFGDGYPGYASGYGLGWGYPYGGYGYPYGFYGYPFGLGFGFGYGGYYRGGYGLPYRGVGGGFVGGSRGSVAAGRGFGGGGFRGGGGGGHH